MRYLQNRHDFLHDKISKKFENTSNLNNQIKKSAIINETFENDITWGGSMVGRLINSTIRRLKIGYSQTRVEPLIKKLEDELNYLLSAAMQGDMLKQYNSLMVRQFMEEIRNTCITKNLTDEDKLDKLLGQHQGLYDPNDPTKNQKTNGFVQKALDFITTDLKDLEKLFGEDRNKLIDKISDFNDDLRKLTVQPGTPVDSSQSGNVGNFNLNFLNTLNAIKKQPGLVTASFNFDRGFVNNYDLFNETRLFETEEQKAITDTKKPNTTNTKTDPKQVIASPTEKTNTLNKKEVDNVTNLLKTKKDSDLKNNDLIKKLLNDISTKLPKDQLSKIKVNFDNKEITVADALDKLKSQINESMSYFILETGSSMGGQSGVTQSVTTVNDVWDSYEFDKNRDITRLTQREVDEMNSMLTSGTQDLRYEPAKRPDPIVSISRIFGEAHQLYFTDVIPSGRPNGRVSQKTFREYYKLGTSPAKWDDGQAPEGPFAVKSIFNKWKTGVEKLLMNQEYRKILANVKFVVPGAEDKFNDNFNTKIFEAEKEGVEISKTASQGQILFDFINSMLDKKKLDDFDTLRSNLMSKYFGINLTSKDKTPESTPPNTPPTKTNIEPNVAYFKVLESGNEKIDIKKSKFYAIPIKKITGSDGKDHTMVFLQAIKYMDVNKTDDTLLVKFTYDEPILMKKYTEKKLPGIKYTDWSTVGIATQKMFYGLMSSGKLKLSDGAKLTIFFGNINNPEVQEVTKRDFIIQSGPINLNSRETIDIKPSKFVYNEQSSIKDINPKDFEIKILTNEKNTHVENLNKLVKDKGGKKLIDVLKEEIKPTLPT
jgi:hypothetical protein